MNESIQMLSHSPLGEICAGVLGLLFGSFYNVVILRLPEHKDIVFLHSHCPKCESPIPWYLNVPVISYVMLLGKCRHCKAKISIQYPLVELATGALFLLMYLKFGWSWQWLAYTLFSSALLILSVIDLHHRIIPDELSLGGLVVGFLFSFGVTEVDWKASLGGIGLGGGIFFAVAWMYQLLAKREGLGGGDIKLLGMIGAWLGYKSILGIVLISSAVGSLIGGGVMLIQRGGLKTAIPFGPFLSLAALLYIFFGEYFERLMFPPMP